MPLKDANVALAAVQGSLELGDAQSIDQAACDGVAAYNKDDCDSTEALRDWLEQLRTAAIADGKAIDRPQPGAEGPSEKVAEREAEINAMIERLTHDVPVDQPREQGNSKRGGFSPIRSTGTAVKAKPSGGNFSG